MKISYDVVFLLVYCPSSTNIVLILNVYSYINPTYCDKSVFAKNIPKNVCLLN